jgi:anti-sigma factor RsiW
MSHVDEGALHAYLDGALDEYPAAEARHVREHLDSCGECLDRLEVERAIRDQAVSILGLAVPEVTAPSFEELRAYARPASSVPAFVVIEMSRPRMASTWS